MTGVFYLSLTENTQKDNLIKFKNSDSQFFSDNNLEKITIENKEKETSISNSENCTEENTQFKYLPDLIAKSIMAFLAGCILSEKKFFRFGII